MDKVLQFIKNNIDKTTKVFDKTVSHDTLIELPYPYTTPCVDGMFQEMYYWDTYFTNKGLLALGKYEQAVNNVKNFASMVERFGFVLNGNRTYYLGRSQPPVFALMVQDVINTCPQLFDSKTIISALEKEHEFWITKRTSPNGLAHYDSDASNEEHLGAVRGYNYRLGEDCLDVTVENGRNVFAECESGWDFSPRFSKGCTNYNAVDLNCLLYSLETVLSKYSDKKDYYLACANKRKNSIVTLMRGADGLYYDYCYLDKSLSGVLSSATFFPYFVGIESDINSFLNALKQLELPCGVVTCLPSKRTGYQWGYPNGWAPLNFVAFGSALKLGLTSDANRIATKFVNTVTKLYEQTGKLWEKFNAVDGSLNVASEYDTPAMLGWTAGTYVVMKNYLQIASGECNEN